MKIQIPLFLLLCITFSAIAQNPKPAPPQQGTVVIRNATLHIGNGTVIEKGVLVMENGKITYAGNEEKKPEGARVIDAAGKQVYPGFIAANNYMGLSEIELVRSTLDYSEVGDINPNIRSLIAYNTDSRIIPTVRVNGVLLSQCTPQGGIVSGTSSVVQLDAWNWEDAAYAADNGIHIHYPDYYPGTGTPEQLKQQADNYARQFQLIDKLMTDAKAYDAETSHTPMNLKLESMRGLFHKTKTLYVHVDYIKGILHALDYFKKYNMKMVLVGGTDSYQAATQLHDAGVAVILHNTHRLPSHAQDAPDLPYRVPSILKQAGVLFCICTEGTWQIRNLPFMAGTAAAYGLTKEEALQSITRDAAVILGIGDRTGTLEAGKDANLFISEGDALDMQGNKLLYAFIQGREISLDNSQKQLYNKYSEKYNIKHE